MIFYLSGAEMKKFSGKWRNSLTIRELTFILGKD